MAPRYYQGDITRLSDSELNQLSDELIDAGVTSIDPYDYDEGDWFSQAYNRYDEIRWELGRRWELANPEEAAKRRSSREAMAPLLDAQIEYYRPKLMEMFENSQRIAKLLRGK